MDIAKKTLLVLLFLGCINQMVYAQEVIANKNIILPKKEFMMEELIQYLDSQYQIKFAYEKPIINQKEILVITKTKLTLKELLELFCHKYGLTYKYSMGQVILKKSPKSSQSTIHGYIYDRNTGEVLTGATVYSLDNHQGTSSNSYGYYSLTLPQGSANISYSFIGSTNQVKEVNLNSDQNINIYLSANPTELQEVTVAYHQNEAKARQIEAGLEQLTIKEIAQLPSFLGEVDVLKGLQHLPGVQSVNDGISLLSVRGGTFDQNLVLLDEAPIYNPTHVLGFFSVFNPDAVTQADIYKGYIPVRYDGRLSSVIDVRMKDGNRNKLTTTANINLFASRLTLETPIVNENTSLLIAGRYSYTSAMANLGREVSNVIDMPEYYNYPSETKINFWDLNLKVNHRINEKNRIYLSGYHGSDYFFYPLINKKSSIEWGNSTTTLRWNHIFSSKLFLNTSLIISHYQYAYLFIDNGYSYNWKAGMKDLNLKTDFDWYLNPTHTFNFGFSVNNHHFKPGSITPTESGSSVEAFELEQKQVLESSIYASYRFTRRKWGFESGLRINNFYNQYNREQGSLNKSYLNLAPRLAAKYQFNPYQSLKLAYSRTYQYLHLLNNATIGFPTDIWLPADAHIKPQGADQLSMGYAIEWNQSMFEAGTDIYYKKMYNIIDFVDNANLFMKESVESEIKNGSGECYGLELMLSKKLGWVKGNISYTFAKAEKTIPGINQGITYPFSNDNRHCFNTNVNIEIGRKWVAMADFNYKSGSATTMIEGFYFYEEIPFAIYSDRNGYRLPAYHKLDLALTHKNKQKEGRKWQMEWTIGVNNVYNRKNVFGIYFSHNYYYESSFLKQLYLFGRIPFASLTIKF